MHDGIDDEGRISIPPFPILGSRLVSREDDDAILAFLKTTPAVKYTPPNNDLTFPLEIRSMVKGWNLLYLKSHDFQADSSQSPEWNRGAYLVNGFGHCGGCHTPKNAFGADKSEPSLPRWHSRQLGGAGPDRQRSHGSWRLERSMT